MTDMGIVHIEPTWRTATYSGHSGCVSVAVIEGTRRG